jgi:hypothetical protein
LEHANVNKLAVIAFHRGAYGEAESLYSRALSIQSKAYPQGHPEFASTLSNYALMLKKTQRTQEAKQAEAQAKQMFSTHRSENQRRTVTIQELEAAVR